LDVTPLVQPKMTGVQIVTRDIVKKLSQNYPDENWVLFATVPRAHMKKFEKLWDNLEVNTHKIFIPLPSRLFHLIMPQWQKRPIIPLETIIGRIDHYHSFEWFHLPTLGKNSATLQDWFPMRHPEKIDDLNLKVFTSRWQAICKAKSEVVVISDFLKEEVAKTYPEITNRLIRIHNGIPIDCMPPSKKEAGARLKRFNIGSDYFLSVGTITYRKNYTTLLQAYRRYRNKVSKPLNWVVVANTAASGFKLDNEPGVILLKDAKRPEIMALYSKARSLLFPSWYEAFGLPLLEATVCGCPVVSSDIPAAHEIGGSQFTYVNPDDISGWAECMNKEHQKTSADDRFDLDKIAASYYRLFRAKNQEEKQ